MRASQISLSISGWTGGVSAAVLMIPVGPSAVIMTFPVGLSAPGLAALAAGYCAQLANCFGAPLVGARGFLGFRPLLFGMEREPAAPAGSTLFTFQDIAEYTGSLGGSRLRHHVRGKRSAVLSHECSIFVRGRAAPARDSRQDAPRPAPHMKGRKCKWPNLSQCRSIP